MQNVYNSFSDLIVNLEGSNNYDQANNGYILRSLEDTLILKHIYAINNFALLNVKKDDWHIYAKQIVREIAVQYEKLMTVTLHRKPEENWKNEIQNGLAVIRDIKGKNVDISSLFKNIAFFTGYISMCFDCGNIKLNSLNVQIASSPHYHFAEELDYTPYDEKNR